MKLITLYYSKNARYPKATWNPKVVSNNHLLDQFSTDGYAYLFQRLIEEKCIDKALTFVETGSAFGHKVLGTSNNIIYAVPSIQCVEQFIEKNDVLFIRGGWRPWAEPLAKWKQLYNSKMIYYGAGTNRENWPFWSTVLSDFVEHDFIKNNKLYTKFTKPINPKIFYPSKIDKEFDICLSNGYHLYDKKAQYLVIAAAIEYKRMFGQDLKIVLPGSMYRSTHTSGIDRVISDNKLHIYRSGTVDRSTIAKFANQSRLAVHLGYGDCVPRSTLEAMACDLPVYIAQPKQYPAWVSSNANIYKQCATAADPRRTAVEIHELLEKIEQGTWGIGSCAHFNKFGSVELTVNQFRQVLNHE